MKTTLGIAAAWSSYGKDGKDDGNSDSLADEIAKLTGRPTFFDENNVVMMGGDLFRRGGQDTDTATATSAAPPPPHTTSAAAATSRYRNDYEPLRQLGKVGLGASSSLAISSIIKNTPSKLCACERRHRPRPNARCPY